MIKEHRQVSERKMKIQLAARVSENTNRFPALALFPAQPWCDELLPKTTKVKQVNWMKVGAKPRVFSSTLPYTPPVILLQFLLAETVV